MHVCGTVQKPGDNDSAMDSAHQLLDPMWKAQHISTQIFGAVVLVRFAGVYHIFYRFPPAPRSDLLPDYIFLLADYACSLYH
jgi:hypothetical protein